MVDLKQIPAAELYHALEQKDDGKAFVELVGAKAALEKCAMDAQERAGKKILDFMIEYFCEQQDFYQEEYGYNWWEAMKQDDIVGGLFEDKDFKDLVFDYMDLTVG